MPEKLKQFIDSLNKNEMEELSRYIAEFEGSDGETSQEDILEYIARTHQKTKI
jgi:hypothetical protein